MSAPARARPAAIGCGFSRIVSLLTTATGTRSRCSSRPVVDQTSTVAARRGSRRPTSPRRRQRTLRIVGSPASSTLGSRSRRDPRSRASGACSSCHATGAAAGRVTARPACPGAFRWRSTAVSASVRTARPRRPGGAQRRDRAVRLLLGQHERRGGRPRPPRRALSRPPRRGRRRARPTASGTDGRVVPLDERGGVRHERGRRFRRATWLIRARSASPARSARVAVVQGTTVLDQAARRCTDHLLRQQQSATTRSPCAPGGARRARARRRGVDAAPRRHPGPSRLA